MLAQQRSRIFPPELGLVLRERLQPCRGSRSETGDVEPDEEAALARTTPTGTQPGRYTPPDGKLMAFPQGL